MSGAKWSRMLDRSITVTGTLLCTATLVGYFGRAWWMLELFSHFRPQYYVGLTILALISLMRRRLYAAAILTAFLLANAISLAPHVFPQAVTEAAGDTQTPLLRVSTVNLSARNRQHDSILQFIDHTDADLIIVQELTPEWMQYLRAAGRKYAYSILLPREDNFGLALYSRLPIVRSQTVTLGEFDNPAIIATIKWADTEFTIIGLHLYPPVSAELAAMRNTQLARLTEIARALGSPLIIAGDFNSTPWSPHFRTFLQRAALIPTSAVAGIAGTWPAWFAMLSIPIDHCLTSDHFDVVRQYVGPDVGSDHYPIVVDLRYPR